MLLSYHGNLRTIYKLVVQQSVIVVKMCLVTNSCDLLMCAYPVFHLDFLIVVVWKLPNLSNWASTFVKMQFLVSIMIYLESFLFSKIVFCKYENNNFWNSSMQFSIFKGCNLLNQVDFTTRWTDYTGRKLFQMLKTVAERYTCCIPLLVCCIGPN